MSTDHGTKTPARVAQSDGASLVERVAPIQSRARALGLRPDGIDDKPLMDGLMDAEIVRTARDGPF